MEWAKGKKTYFMAGGVALATFAMKMGWIDNSTYQLIVGLFGAGGLAALRAGIKNG